MSSWKLQAMSGLLERFFERVNGFLSGFWASYVLTVLMVFIYISGF